MYAGQPEGTMRILCDRCNPKKESSCLLRGPRSTLVKSQLLVASVAQWWQNESDSIRSDGESSCVLPECSATGTAGEVSAHWPSRRIEDDLASGEKGAFIAPVRRRCS